MAVPEKPIDMDSGFEFTMEPFFASGAVTMDQEPANARPAGPREEAYVIGVINRMGGKAADYYWNGLDLPVGTKCIAQGENGPFFGAVTFARRPLGAVCPRKKPVGKIIRRATEDDFSRVESLIKKEKTAIKYCRERILDCDLAMKLTKAHYTFDGTKAVFFFTSEGRVDFRDLVKDLAAFTRIKVEMRQIGVRDEAKLLNGLGPCGVDLCCARFLNDFAPVSIRMAKDQNLSLNPAKISGVCGRLTCCLAYEHETYKELMAKAPKMNKMVQAPDGRIGRVYILNVLQERVGVLFEDGSREEYGLTEVKPAQKPHGQAFQKPEERTAPPARRESAADKTAPREPVPITETQPGTEPDERTARKKPRRRKKKRGGRSEGQQPADGQMEQRPPSQGPRPAPGPSAGSSPPSGQSREEQGRQGQRHSERRDRKWLKRRESQGPEESSAS